ncbi:hypothetical protein Pyn_21892 [Prunus yedoensis var. nudiflora]|uniref:Uncharacterized protein n=1 Tax=Prunus yedoensis var. nudiflora TaxID=2094558 RepID=A0A314ZP35_PRUYE|nr:hypothetical protein Pyn_21892 [Prunus yedoensis var. nudiflora]
MIIRATNSTIIRTFPGYYSHMCRVSGVWAFLVTDPGIVGCRKNCGYVGTRRPLNRGSWRFGYVVTRTPLIRGSRTLNRVVCARRAVYRPTGLDSSSVRAS